VLRPPVLMRGWGWLPTLPVARQAGLYHPPSPGVWRIVSEDSPGVTSSTVGAFPADCPHLSHCHPPPIGGRVAQDPPGFPAYSQIYLRNYSGPVYSYGRRSPGLQFKALSSEED